MDKIRAFFGFSRAAKGVSLIAAAMGLVLHSTTPAAAEWVLAFYLGANASPESTVEYDFKEGGGSQSTDVSWDGEAMKMPPYFGVRATRWFESHPNWGLVFDNVHAKIAADPMPDGFSSLEFTDGVNMYTGNIHYRWLNDSRYTPYAGAGVGFTTPHVEVRTDGGTSDTFEYQFGGPAAQVLVGVDARINDRWSVFGEAKLAKFWLDVDLEHGGSLQTDVVSRQIALGVSYTLGQR